MPPKTPRKPASTPLRLVDPPRTAAAAGGGAGGHAASTTDQIVDSITTAIVERRLMPGTRLVEQQIADVFAVFNPACGGFKPNGMLIMQRKPKLVRALSQLTAAMWDPESEVPVGFKRLVAHVASKAHGCHY